MVGGYSWSDNSSGDYLSHSITLQADGTGLESRTRVRSYIDYGMGNELDHDDVIWWSQDGKLVIDDTPWDVVTTPNCRLVKMMGVVFTHKPMGPCPQQIAPLTEMEARMVGTWSLHENGRPGESDEYIRLEIEADRNVYFHYSPRISWTYASDMSSTYTSYFNVDSDAVLHGTNIEGKEEFYVRLELTDEGLSFCDFIRPEHCRPLEKE